MNRINLYVLRSLLIGTAVATVVLTFAIWLTQSLRLIEVIVDGQAPMSVFLQMVALSLPNFLVVVVPVAMVTAVLFIYNRLLVDSELVVMRATGMSPIQLAAPAFMLALIVMAASYLLNLYLVPLANQQFRSMRSVIESEYSTVLLREGEFNSIDGITVFIRERERNGEVFGILIHDNRNPERPVTVVAEHGVVQQGAAGPRVVMFDGNRQEADRSAGRVNVLYFDQYTVDLAVLEPRSAAQQWVEPKERFLGDLLNPNPDDPQDVRMATELISMAHQRLSAPLTALAFAGLAMAALLSGEFNRRGQGRRMIAGIAAVVLLQVAELGLANAARKNIAVVPLLYLVPLATLAVSLVIMHRRPPHARRSAAQHAPAE